MRVSDPWWNSLLAVAPRPHLSHVSACQRRSRPQTFALVFSAVAVDSFIVLCHIFSGIGLPRLCGTPCRWIVVSWVEPHRSPFSCSSESEKIHIRHAADVLANIVSTDIGVHLHTLLGDNITSPATPMFFGSSDSWMLSSPVFSPWKFSGQWVHLVFHHKISTGGSHVKAEMHGLPFSPSASEDAARPCRSLPDAYAMICS